MARRNEHIQIAKLAEAFLDELEGNILEVILIPSRVDDIALRGGMIRCVASENARWYREFCLLHPSSRQRPRRKPDTAIKRQWTRRALNELKAERCETLYAKRVKRFIRRWAREESEGGGISHLMPSLHKSNENPMSQVPKTMTKEAELINLATAHLQKHGETIDDWEGICGELASAIATKTDDAIVYVEGDIGWRYHMVMMRDGVVHDAWCEAALPLRDWMIQMFGEHAWIELTIDGDDVFVGHVRDFEIEKPRQRSIAA